MVFVSVVDHSVGLELLDCDHLVVWALLEPERLGCASDYSQVWLVLFEAVDYLDV